MNKNNYFNVLLVFYASLAMIMATCVICINKDENEPIGWYAGISIGMILTILLQARLVRHAINPLVTDGNSAVIVDINYNRV